MTPTPTKQDMERAEKWAECYADEINPPYVSMGNTARCYLHALRRIEALERLPEAERLVAQYKENFPLQAQMVARSNARTEALEKVAEAAREIMEDVKLYAPSDDSGYACLFCDMNEAENVRLKGDVNGLQSHLRDYDAKLAAMQTQLDEALANLDALDNAGKDEGAQT